MVHLKLKIAAAMFFGMAMLLTVTSMTGAAVQYTYGPDGEVQLLDHYTAGVINTAYFFQVDPEGSTGTGVIQPFLHIQKNGSEAGYNTDDADGLKLEYPEAVSPWTRHLLLDDVPIVETLPDGTTGEWREFLLDVNENSGGSNEFISLDRLQIFLGNSPTLTGFPSGLGNLVWNMDAVTNTWIELDYALEAGSGDGDMLAYIPNSLFTGGSYVYLFSSFGTQGTPSDGMDTCDGFEEWAVRVSENVPEPAGLLILSTSVVSMIGLGYRRIRR